MRDKIEFGIIRFVHETLYSLFVNPDSRLSAAGLKPGMKVLEVGCGPGFFTAPAARVVGNEGFVYALDINPKAVEHVERKTQQQGLKNVQVICADASKTGLPPESVDLAFLFSVIHAFPNIAEVMKEMHRVLNSKGTLSIQSGWPEKKLLDAVTGTELFRFTERTGRLLEFCKST